MKKYIIVFNIAIIILACSLFIVTIRQRNFNNSILDIADKYVDFAHNISDNYIELESNVEYLYKSVADIFPVLVLSGYVEIDGEQYMVQFTRVEDYKEIENE